MADNIVNNAVQRPPKKRLITIIFIAVLAVAVLVIGGVGLFTFLESRGTGDTVFTLDMLVGRMNSANENIDDTYRTQGSLSADDFAVWEDYPNIKCENGSVYNQYIYMKSESLALIVSLDKDGNVVALSIKSNAEKYKDNLYLAAGYEQQAALAVDENMTGESAKELIDRLIAKVANAESFDDDSGDVKYGIHSNDSDFSFYAWFSEAAYEDLGYFAAKRNIFAGEDATEATTEKFTISGVGSARSNRGGTVTFSSALSANSDVVGWLGISDTNCTGPVLQTGNNSFYLNHDLYKNYYVHGSRYADFRCNFENGNLSQNTTIYGHYNDSHLIFADLTKYTDLNFYKSHPVIQFDTKYETAYWKVFAVFITNTESSDGAIFEYRDPEFANQESFLYFIERVKRRSVIDTGVDVIEDDRILTLSTCSRLMTEWRLVVMARKVRPGEIPGVDISQVKYAENPLFPPAFYKKKVKAYAPYWYGPNVSTYSKPKYADEP